MARSNISSSNCPYQPLSLQLVIAQRLSQTTAPRPMLACSRSRSGGLQCTQVLVHPATNDKGVDLSLWLLIFQCLTTRCHHSSFSIPVRPNNKTIIQTSSRLSHNHQIIWDLWARTCESTHHLGTAWTSDNTPCLQLQLRPRQIMPAPPSSHKVPIQERCLHLHIILPSQHPSSPLTL